MESSAGRGNEDGERSWPALDLRAGESDLLERVHAALAACDLLAIDESSPDRWRIFFRSPEDRSRASAALAAALPDLTLEPVDVVDEDWAARSQSDLRAVRAGGIIVAPPWDRPDDSEAHTIVIQPSMGFGTGHHATTRLCLLALQAIEVRGRTAIDVGCGSGVLAIAASLLGARHVAAFDDDPDAVQSARENVALNPRAAVELLVGDITSSSVVPADVVLANLTGGLLVSASAQLRRLIAPGGVLIVSGLMVGEESDVRAAYADLIVERRAEEDGWSCLTLRQ